jgi:HEAT repeat protein
LQESDPQRRAAAGCAIGRSGSPAHRATVRRLLGDKDAKVRLYAAHGLLGARFPRSGDDGQTPEDEGLLQKAKVASDAAGLSEFFRKRTLGPDDLQQIKMCIKQLSGDKFKDREDASRKLIEYGPAALDLLRDAARGADLEMVRRSEIIIDTISNHPGPALPMAALRLVARRPTADAVPLLLGYIPFVDDTRVEEEALNALAVVSVREARVDPALVAAVKDAHAARRAAAGWVLGRVGEKDHCTLVQALLKDPDVRARLRTSQGLLAARDRTAVDPLIDVLRDGNAEQAAEAEAVLQQLAGEDSPPVYIGEGSAEARRKSQDAWLAWWRDQGSKQELPNLELSNRQLGLTLVAELTGNNANGNRIWEFGLDGKLRWELANLQGPIDAHMLPHGRVLIAEHNGQRVTERDLKGDVKWEHKIQGNPVACQRLANGNTFIATYNMVMEVTPDNRVLYQHNPNAGGVIYDASKLANGNIVCIGGRGTIIEMDTSGKQVKATQVQNNGGWAGVTPLPGGRYLVAMMNPGKVVEVDREGKIGWQCNVQYACHAVRLPNGNTLVACMNSQRVVEVNRNGEKVWERQTTGRPFHVRRR